MKMGKIMLIALLSFLVIMSGCAKDEVVPMTDQSATGEKASEEIVAGTQDNEEQDDKKADPNQTDAANNIEEKQETVEEAKDDSASTPKSVENTEPSSNTKKNETINTAPKTSTNTNETPEKKNTATTNKSTTNNTASNNTTTNNTDQSTKKTPTTKPTEEKQTTNSTTKPAATPNKQQTTPTQKVEPKQTVTVSVVSDTGTILSPTKVEIKEGQTVIDVTLAILKQRGIQVSVTGSGSSAYVEGINNLYEFDKGPLSGWMVKKNGVKLTRSSGAVQVKNGDTVQWIYTTNYVEDEK